jgi:hypothetical protein
MMALKKEKLRRLMARARAQQALLKEQVHVEP